MRYAAGLLLAAGLAAGCGGGGELCSSGTPCSDGNPQSYRFCNTSSTDCYYRTSDGQELHCLSCGDCSNARSALANWCSGLPAGSTTGNGGTSCNSATSCPSGVGSYQGCTSFNGTECSFNASDGNIFYCNSCTDCSAAEIAANDWCLDQGSSTGSTAGATSGSTSGGTTGTTTTSCDVAAQDCAAGNKCVGTINADGTISGICVTDGTLGEGAACTFTSGSTTFLDDCKAGLICDDLFTNVAPTCRKICSTDSDCGGDQKCGDFTLYSPGWGWCAPTCTPFSSATGNCAAGHDCSETIDDADQSGSGFFFCKISGTGAPYSTCAADSDCGAGTLCEYIDSSGTDVVCVPICSDSHPCQQPPVDAGISVSVSCIPYTGQPDNAGYCFSQ